MQTNVTKSVLNSILSNKKVGTVITTKNIEKFMMWLDELRPYLDKLEKMGYIKGTWRSNVKFKIIKKISDKIISKL